MGSVFGGDLGRAISAAHRHFTLADLERHRARMERCRLSGCDSERGEHRCQDDEQDWGDDAA